MSLLFGVGCAAAGPPGTPIGMSDAVPERGAPRAVAPTQAAAPWPDFKAALAWPEAAAKVPALVHRRDGALVRVRVEPGALAAYQALSVEAPMPDGARVMAWHETATGELLGGYLLEKQAGVWSASEVDARGILVPGDHTSCVRCHDMAPTDHLFGRRLETPSVPTSLPGPGTLNGESIKPSLR